ncbi:MAG: hypothetical protein V7609_3111 [Verrucomicrobiota bacterium]
MSDFLILACSFCECDIARLEVQLGFGRSSKNAGAVIVELTFPSGDYNRGKTVADQVHAGAAHVHELVHAEGDGDTDRAEAGREEAVGARPSRLCGGWASRLRIRDNKETGETPVGRTAKMAVLRSILPHRFCERDVTGPGRK